MLLAMPTAGDCLVRATQREGWKGDRKGPTAPLRCPRPYNDGDSCARVEQLLRSPDCLVGLSPERYGATVARLRRIFLRFLDWFLIDMKYGATVARLRHILLMPARSAF